VYVCNLHSRKYDNVRLLHTLTCAKKTKKKNVQTVIHTIVTKYGEKPNQLGEFQVQHRQKVVIEYGYFYSPIRVS
jgi:hypothetical protein